MMTDHQRFHTTDVRKTDLPSESTSTLAPQNHFNPSDGNSVALPTPNRERHQLRQSSYRQTFTRKMPWRRLGNGNCARQLRALLYEALAISSTTASPAAIANATISKIATRLIPFSDATGTTATAPFATNARALTAVPTTIVATLSAVSARARAITANAFMQMNSTSSWDDSIGASESPTSMLDISVVTTSGATPITNATIAGAETSIIAHLVASPWPKALAVAIFVLLILVTVVGNTLVILSMLTTRRLRTVTNCFVMNLAITDWLVGTCVMPPAVMLYIVGSWHYGWILCDIWISLDVLLCTGSILSLCAISLDRYLAVTQPLTYSKKRRSKRLALIMIFIVWVTALLITCPPYLGWYEQGRRREGYAVCRYNQNKGYVVFSAMGSFFIPLAVMMYVYLKIGYVLTSRRQRIARDANSERTPDHYIDCDNFISESEHYQCITPKLTAFRTRCGSGSGNRNSNNCFTKNLSTHCSKCNKAFWSKANGSAAIKGGLGQSVVVGGLNREASFYELVEATRLTSLIQCPAICCKYAGGGGCMHSNATGVPLAERRSSSLPMQAVHFAQDTTSFSENCLAAAAPPTASRMNTGQGMRFGPALGQSQQQLQAQLHQQSNHQNPHRMTMRVSTTKRDSKTAKTLTTVMGGFIACWLPFFTYYLLVPFLPSAAVSHGLMSFLTWVGWVNCAINPFIYAFYNPDFRTAFWRLTCRRICKQKTPPNHIAMFRG